MNKFNYQLFLFNTLNYQIMFYLELNNKLKNKTPPVASQVWGPRQLLDLLGSSPAPLAVKNIVGQSECQRS